MEALHKSGLMMPEGLKAFGLIKENKSGIYSHEKEPADLDPIYKRGFKLHK